MVGSSARGPEDFGELEALILRQLTDEERATSAVYLDRNLRQAGQGEIGGHESSSASAYYLAFIDQRPGANWMHPCRYLMIDPAAGKTASIQSDRPPQFGALPPTWRVVWRPSGIEAWRLLRISSPITQKPKKEEQP